MRRSPTARSATEHLVALLLLGGAARGAAVRPVRHAVSQTEVRQRQHIATKYSGRAVPKRRVSHGLVLPATISESALRWPQSRWAKFAALLTEANTVCNVQCNVQLV